MKYVINKGSAYLKKTKKSYEITSKLNEITLFDTMEDAEDAKVDAKNKGVMKKGWSVIPFNIMGVDVETDESTYSENEDVVLASESTDYSNDIVSDISTNTMPEKGYFICGKEDFVGVNGAEGLCFTKDTNLVKVFVVKQDAHDALLRLVKKTPGMVGYKVLNYEKELFLTYTHDGVYDAETAYNSATHVFAQREPNEEIDGVVSAFISEYNKKMSQYVHEQSVIEKKLTDIEHLIEFSEFEEGDPNIYKLYLLQRKVLRERRDIKDNITKLQKMQNVMTQMRKVLKGFKSLSARIYTPREYDSLFKEMENSGMVVNPSLEYINSKKERLTPKIKTVKTVSSKPSKSLANKNVGKKKGKRSFVSKLLRKCQNDYNSILLHQTSSTKKKQAI